MEAQHCDDAIVDTRIHLRRVLFAELVRLGQRIQWSGAVRHDAGLGVDLVCD